MFHTYQYAAYLLCILRKSTLHFFLLGRLKLRFQGHVTELLGATSTKSSQEKVAGAAIIHLRPQVRTDGDIWQHFVGLKTAFWLRCRFFYMPKNYVKRLNCGEKNKQKQNMEVNDILLCMQCLIGGSFVHFIFLFLFIKFIYLCFYFCSIFPLLVLQHHSALIDIRLALHTSEWQL